MPVAGTYTFAVFADDGFSFNGNGLMYSNGTARAAMTTSAARGLARASPGRRGTRVGEHPKGGPPSACDGEKLKGAHL